MEIGTTVTFCLVIVISYFIGSVPFGLVLTRLAGLGDVRKQGSGNIGATNVLRIAGKKLALATLLLDGLKGAVAVMIGIGLLPNTLGVWAGLACVLGHNFPVWLKFKGGKGVATTFFVLVMLTPLVAFFSGLAWVVTFSISRISSLSALVAAVIAPCLAWWLAPEVNLLILCLSFLLIIRHKANIVRLLNKTEPKFTKSV